LKDPPHPRQLVKKVFFFFPLPSCPSSHFTSAAALSQTPQQAADITTDQVTDTSAQNDDLSEGERTNIADSEERLLGEGGASGAK